MVLGHQDHLASVRARQGARLPHRDAQGWYHLPRTGDLAKATWPKPVPGGFNYYHVSTQHLLDCIVEDREPVLNVTWGRHITEMMIGTSASARTGQRYVMTTTLEGDDA